MVTKSHTSLNKPATCRPADTGLSKYVWLFVPHGKKGLRELNVCETNNLGNKNLWTGP